MGLVFQNTAWKRVEWGEISYLFGNWVLDNERFNDVISWQEEMCDFFFGILYMKFELFQIVIQKLMNGLNILLFHCSETLNICVLWEFVNLYVSGHRRILWQRRESNLDELLWIERSVIISSGCNRTWDNYTSSINSLPNVTSIYSSRNLTNQHWCQSFSSQWLVDTKEVDLCHFHCDVIDTHVDWHTRDEAVELLLFTTSDPEEPILVVTRWSKCPLEEFDRVIEPKHVIVIFDIVLSQEIVDLFAFFVILDVDVAPPKSSGDVEWFSSDIWNLFIFIDLLVIVLGRNSIGYFRNWLRIPEVMSIIERGYLSDILLSLIGLLLFGQSSDEIFNKSLSVCGTTTGDNIFQILFVIWVQMDVLELLNHVVVSLFRRLASEARWYLLNQVLIIFLGALLLLFILFLFLLIFIFHFI